jgi:dTDP-4-dehydrorhamnose 3,5-epimerase
VEFIPTSLPEVVLIKPRVFGDQRGFFLETFRADRFKASGIDATFVQDNHSHSQRGTLRGLHFQIEQTQGKLVGVTHGSVYDVAVDVRRSSPTFGQWVGVTLSAENHHMLWVPPGFAHGFLTLSERADFIYKCTDYYAPEHERALRWDDPKVGIAWPIPAGSAPILSAKDSAAPNLSAMEALA